MASRIKKIFVGFLALFMILAAIILAIRAVWNYTEGRKLSAALEKARASGVALQMKDLVPNCPDSENAAIPWKAAWALIPLNSQDNSDRQASQKAIESLFEGRLPEGEPRILLADLMNKNKRVIELMEDASKRTCFRLNDWGKPAYEAEFKNAGRSLISMRLLAIDAALQAASGDIENALNRCLAGLRLSQTVIDEPFLINGLVSLAESRICLYALRAILNGREISSDLLVKIIKEIDPLPLRVRFARTIPGELAYSLESGAALLRGEAKALGADRFWTWLTRPLIKAQGRSLLEKFDGLEKISGKAYFAQTTFHENYNRMIETLPARYWLLKAVLPNYQTAFMKVATLEAVMLTTRTGLACRLYKLKTGTYPENLDALAPEFLPEVPIDPFTGKPLVYKLENGLPLIYSFGSNFKDDGGRSTYQISKLIAEKDDDWAWRETVLR